MENLKAKLNVPRIFLESGYLLDTSYERAVENQPIIEEFCEKAQTYWDECGTAWLAKTVEMTGVGFKRKELTGFVIMHPEVKSCSNPLLFNINRHLPKPDPMHFSELVYHEVLHIYLGSEFPYLWKKPFSPLLRKYAEADDHATAHLHLYALQKAVFLDLGQESLWQSIVDETPFFQNKGYQRAIEILDIEGEEAFLRELER